MARLVCRYPLSVVSGICLLLFFAAGMFFHASYIGQFEAQYLIITMALLIGTHTFLQRIIFIFISLLFLAIYLWFSGKLGILLSGELILAMFVVLFHKKTADIGLFFIILAAFLLHLYYIQATDINIRQHDLNGILYYMQEITQNGINITGFNPWNMYYLFHQPLHFIIIGYIYLLELSLGFSVVAAKEGLQYLSLFYTSATTIVIVKILKKFNVDGYILYGATLLFVFNPTLFLLSGYISDDTPVLFWSSLFLYQLICWYQTGNTQCLFWAACCFGIGTLTKLSILMLTPAVAFLFIYKLFSTKDKVKITTDLSLFVVIAVPLSLIWIIRNHMWFDMPFYNVPDTSPAGQNFRYFSFWERLFDFSQILSPFIDAPAITDKNMWLSLIKTELFGEWNLSKAHSFIYFPAFVLYLLTLLFKVFVLLCVLMLLYQQKYRFCPFAVFCIIIYFTIWLYSFKYAMDYPYVCSSDYRLFTSLMFSDVMISALVLKDKPAKAVFFFVASVAYASLSAFIYVFAI